MGETPDEIREDIERTRDRMSEHADALAYKADVPARAQDRVTDVKESVMSGVTHAKDSIVSKVTGAKDNVTDAVSGAKDSVTGSIADHTPSSGEVKAKARQARGLAQSNPLGLAVGAIAAGFVVGLLVPTTRFENEHVGPVADDVKDKAKALGQEAADRARDVATTTVTAARDAAAEAGSRNAEEIKESAGETVGSGSRTF